MCLSNADRCLLVLSDYLFMNISYESNRRTQICECFVKFKIRSWHGAGEMALQLRAPASVAEDLSVVASTHMVDHKCP